MVNNFSVDWVGLYVNWANNSLIIILGKLPTYKNPTYKKPYLPDSTYKNPVLINVVIFSDVVLVSKSHGSKGEKINVIPYYDRYYLQNCKAITFRNITNDTKYK